MTGPQARRAYPSSDGPCNRPHRARGLGQPRSQRQQGRLGAAGDPDPGVRAGAQPGRDVQPRGPGIARAGVRRDAGAGPWPGPASRSQLVTSAPTHGQADLAAVGVPGEDRVVAVGGELVEHPEVRRVGDAEAQVGRRRRPGRRPRRGRRTPGAGRRRRRRRTRCPRPSGGRRRVGQVDPAGVARSRRAGRARAAAGCGCCAGRRRAAGSAAGCAGSGAK